MLSLLRSRRSIRKYKNKQIPQEIFDILNEALLRSQSSRNIRPWQFILIRDKKQLQHLSKSKQHGSTFLNGAAAAFVIIADHTKSDVWIEDTSIASMQLQLTADSLGLGSCWIQIRNRMASEEMTSDQYVKEYLQIPKDFSVLSIIALGYPDENPTPHPIENLDFDKIKTGGF